MEHLCRVLDECTIAAMIWLTVHIYLVHVHQALKKYKQRKEAFKKKIRCSTITLGVHVLPNNVNTHDPCTYFIPPLISFTNI